jgi:hypothetical protein
MMVTVSSNNTCNEEQKLPEVEENENEKSRGRGGATPEKRWAFKGGQYI